MSSGVHPDRSVRPAQRGDAPAIAQLQYEVWRSLMGESALGAQGITVETLAAQWEETLGAPRPAGSALLVALHGNMIVGFALAGRLCHLGRRRGGRDAGVRADGGEELPALGSCVAPAGGCC